jgi:hypothetical protein
MTVETVEKYLGSVAEKYELLQKVRGLFSGVPVSLARNISILQKIEPCCTPS